MLKIALRSLGAHKVRLLLTAAAVFLGVAFVTGMLMLTHALDRTFVDIFEGGAQDVLVTRTSAVTQDITQDSGDDQGQLIDQSTVDQVASVQGVAAADGAIFQNGAYLLDADGEVVGANGPPAAGVNWQSNPALAVATITQGQGPTDRSRDRRGRRDVPQARHSRRRRGHDGGARGPDQGPTGRHVQVRRDRRPGGRDDHRLHSPAGTGTVHGPAGKWQSVEVAAADGYSDQQVADAIATQLGDGWTVKTRDQQVEESASALRQGLGFITYILMGFAGIALFVAAFLIYNTFSMLVAQRGREMALLRAVGTSRRQVLTSVLVEALVLALVSAAIGIGLGYLIARLLVALLETFGLSLTAGVALTLQAVVWAVVLAVIVTVLSALLPAIKAARTPPLAALREAETPVERPGRWRTVSGVVLFLVSAIALATGFSSDPPLRTVALGALGLLVAVVLLAPVLAIGAAKLAGGLMRVGGVSGQLAARNAERGPRRVASTASALLIGLALVTTVAVVVASARESINQLIDRAFGADYVVATQTGNPFSAGIATKLRDVPDVEYVLSQSQGPARVDKTDQLITAMGGGPLTAVFDLKATAGDVEDLTQGNAVADADWARDAGVVVGDRVTVLFPSGQTRAFTVQGIFEPLEAGLLSGLVIPKDDYRSVGGAAQDTLLYVALKPGVDPATALTEVKTVTDENPLLRVLDQASIKQENSKTINQMLYLIYGMLGLSIIIAALGVVNTMALSVLERTREIGLLRAVGASRRQVRRMIRWEAILVAVMGALIGVLVGLAAGICLRQALSGDGIEVLVIPFGTVATILLLAVLLGIAAAAVPARRAARLDILGAIATE
ncbi:MAG: FtsX-like permease family protein [Candidatus Nanopelagicales bacterium]